MDNTDEEIDPTEYKDQEEESEFKTIKSLVDLYFGIVKQNLVDYIPKTIITMMINESCEISDSRMVTQLYRDDKLENLLSMDSGVLNKIKDLEREM